MKNTKSDKKTGKLTGRRVRGGVPVQSDLRAGVRNKKGDGS